MKKFTSISHELNYWVAEIGFRQAMKYEYEVYNIWKLDDASMLSILLSWLQ